MAGLLSAIGGTLAGIGTGIAEQAAEDGKAKREARLMELQHGYAMKRQEGQQQFQTSERVAGEQYQTRRDATKFDQDKELKGIDHGYRMGEIGAQGANAITNTKLADELATKRADTAYGRETEAATTKHGREVELENIRSGNRITEKRAEAGSKGFSLGTNDDKLLNDLRGQYYESEYDQKDPAIEDKIAARLEGMGRRDLASYVRGRWESLPIPAELQPSGPSVNGPGQGQRQPQTTPNPASPPAATQSPQATSPPSGKGPQTEALPSDPGQLVRGKVYSTSRGPARWNGSTFEAVR